MATAPTTPKANPALNAVPGETSLQYEARLGATNNSSTNNGGGTGFGTPISGFSNQNINPTTGQPMPTYTPQQLYGLKSTLESNANSEGSGLSSVPTNSNTPTTTPPPFDLQAELAKLSAPTAPDTAAVQADAENQYGVTGLQTTLNTQNQQYQQLQNELQTKQAGEASKPGVVRTIVNGRMQMLSAEDAKAFSDLKAQIGDTTKQLTQANTAVATYVKNKKTDYANAEKQYQTDYSNTIKLYQDEVDNQNKAQASAKANAQVIINSYKGSSSGVNSITPDMEAQWTSLEQQAGLPPGTIKAAVTAELNIQKFVKGGDGNMYVTGTDANGNPYTAQVVGSSGSGSGTGGTGGSKTPGKSDISSMSGELKSVAGTDGYISPQDWQTALNAWVNAGYTTASFVTAFKAYANTADPSNKYAAIPKTAKGN